MPRWPLWGGAAISALELDAEPESLAWWGRVCCRHARAAGGARDAAGGLPPQPPGARGADLPASGLLEVTPRGGGEAASAAWRGSVGEEAAPEPLPPRAAGAEAAPGYAGTH